MIFRKLNLLLGLLFFAGTSAIVSATGLQFASEPMLELSPSHTGGFTLVENPTVTSVAQLRADGGKPLVVSLQFGDEAYALTNWAESASAVVFEQIPREHLLHTWKLLGVKLLKNITFYPEGSADHFRREASFSAYKSGADGIWLSNVDDLPDAWKTALDEVREDWRILVYLKNLSDKAEQSDDPFVRKESRRVNYWLSYMPADRENLDTLRLECVAYAKRLEQLLGVGESRSGRASPLPIKRSPAIENQTLSFMPYSDWDVKPVQLKFSSNKLNETLRYDGGLSFRADYNGFSFTFSNTNGVPLPRWTMPGGTLDFRLYIPDREPGKFLPYYFHCDLNPQWYSKKRAPATGREQSLFGIDERFRPFSIAWATPNPRVWVWPRLRDYGPDYPDPRPRLSVEGNPKGGWTATLSFSWLSFYGFWPMQRTMKSDLWFFGLDKSPVTGKPVAGRVLWPKGSSNNFVKFASPIYTGAITEIYKSELYHSENVWNTAWQERFYPFAKTENETFHRYDTASDKMFYERMAHPSVSTNDNAWQLIWTDKEHQNPKFNKQSDNVKMTIWRKLDKMLYLSHNISELRRDYLELRYSGKEPPELIKKTDLSKAKLPDEPDVDFDSEAIQLDDKEF